jgi:phage terminase small subunit
MPRTRGLTPKQQRFVEEYLVDLNATQAAVRAGYSAKVANREGTRLLSNAVISLAILKRQERRAARVEVSQDQVLRELALLGFSDIGEILDFTGAAPRLRDAHGIPERARRAIASIKVKRYVEGPAKDDEEPNVVEVMEFKLWPKPQALELLARHLGMLKDRATPSEGEVNVGLTIVFGADLSHYPQPQAAIDVTPGGNGTGGNGHGGSGKAAA